MADYSYRLYEDTDADKCAALFSACFKKERRLDEWNWLYRDNPFGQRSVVCECGGELAGFYGVLCRPVSLGGMSVIAGHVLDVMTHPGHQGKGVFTGCAKAAFSESRRAGVTLFFGFPNKIAMPGHAKVNWRLLGKRHILKRAATTGNEHLGGGRSDIEIEMTSWSSLEGIGTSIDELGFRGPMVPGLVGDRGRRWLKWRYGDRPGFVYSLAVIPDASEAGAKGWIVFRSRFFEESRVGHIVDYAVDRGKQDLVNALMTYAVLRLSSEGCEFIQCLENPWSRILAGDESVWATEPERSLPFIVRATDAEGKETPNLSMDECYLNLGDCDVF